MAVQDDKIECGEILEGHSTQAPSDVSAAHVQVPVTQPEQVLEMQKEPEINISLQEKLGATAATNEESANVQELKPFNWAEFQSRYDNAIAEVNNNEVTLLQDFNDLVNYFGVWAMASSQYDEDRAMKRLKTRQTYVQNAEHSLEEKREHYTRVVEAFKNALALLASS